MSKDQEVICVIDDDPVFTMSVQRLMIKMGYRGEFLLFKDGADAIDFFRYAVSHQVKLPAVILLDINMPKVDGWEFLKEFREWKSQTEHVKIFIVSSDTDEKIIQWVDKQSDLQSFIFKPVIKQYIQKILEFKTPQSI